MIVRSGCPSDHHASLSCSTCCTDGLCDSMVLWLTWSSRCLKLWPGSSYTASCAFRLGRGWTIWGGGQMRDWGAGSTRANSGLYHRICVSFGPEGEPQCKLCGGQPQHELRLGAPRPKGAESSREMAQQALIPTVGFLVGFHSTPAACLLCSFPHHLGLPLEACVPSTQAHQRIFYR